jgi:hypothetical protein
MSPTRLRVMRKRVSAAGLITSRTALPEPFGPRAAADLTATAKLPNWRRCSRPRIFPANGSIRGHRTNTESTERLRRPGKFWVRRLAECRGRRATGIIAPCVRARCLCPVNRDSLAEVHSPPSAARRDPAALLAKRSMVRRAARSICGIHRGYPESLN